jgi:hypothetical protein
LPGHRWKGLRSPSGRIWAAVVGAVLCCGAVLVGVSLAQDASDDAAVQAVKTVGTKSGPHKWAQAFGLDPSAARAALTDANGRVSLVANDNASCLLRDEDPESDQCFLNSNIARGAAVSVQVDCSTGSDGSIVIEGLLPPGAKGAEVTVADSAQPLKAISGGGAFSILGDLAKSGQTTLTAIRYLDAGGKTTLSHDVPGGSDLCLTR